MTVPRPGPFRWICYAFGGGLPARHRSWVLGDASCPSGGLRHSARAFVQMAPVAIPVLLLVPGPLWIRLVAILLGRLVGLQYALHTMQESVERRVPKAGHPRGPLPRSMIFFRSPTAPGSAVRACPHHDSSPSPHRRRRGGARPARAAARRRRRGPGRRLHVAGHGAAAGRGPAGPGRSRRAAAAADPAERGLHRRGTGTGMPAVRG
ncbi:MAG: DUF5313 family protein [Pseudonocardia sp.]|nr:DUF5313 family protein [Pseudonocardia sp.]